MKTFLVSVKVGLLVSMHFQLAYCSGAFKYERLAHFGMKNHRGMKSLKPSRCSCATVCAMNSDCPSFSYDLQTRICRLRNSVHGNTDIAYDKCKRHDNKRPRDLRCQVFRRHQPYVPDSRLCAKGADVRVARRRVSNGISSYTCENQDFKICYMKTISAHQCRWETLTGMCGRFSWRNPRTNHSLFLPFDSLDEFSVTIRGTPDGDSRFDVYVKNNQDTVFYVDFRFKFGYEHHCILCNTFINDEWGKEDHGGVQTLQIGKPCSVTIILRDGMFRLVVDGKRRCTIPKRRRGAQPQYIVIQNEITVHSVEMTV